LFLGFAVAYAVSHSTIHDKGKPRSKFYLKQILPVMFQATLSTGVSSMHYYLSAFQHG
jgi:hypothetical protein